VAGRTVSPVCTDNLVTREDCRPVVSERVSWQVWTLHFKSLICAEVNPVLNLKLFKIGPGLTD
jgi:hypothetical protein